MIVTITKHRGLIINALLHLARGHHHIERFFEGIGTPSSAEAQS
jgi:hypothetical protein